MKIKDEKGSMAVYVLIVLLSMLLMLTTVFLTSNSARKSQLKTVMGIKQAYEADNDKAADIYNSITKKSKNKTISYVTDGLILYYDAVNNTGNGHSNTETTWKDLSGNGNDLALSNFDNTTTSGWSENALNFDGIDDFGAISTLAQTLQGDVTISTRIYSQNANNYRGIYGNYQETDYGISGMLAQYQDGLMRIGYNSNIVEINSDLITNKELTLTIQMGACIGTKVYINGNLVGEKHTDSDSAQPEADFWIGKSFNTTDRYFLGKMNNFMVYNRLLSDAEIKQNYGVDEAKY